MESKPPNILYVEDDRDLVLLVKERLAQARFTVDVAYDGEEALAKYAEGSYDLLAIDQTLPLLDGLGVLRAIASNGPLPPTVMVTGTGNEKVAVQTMKLGADDYIVKDLDGEWLDLLPGIIERVLRQRCRPTRLPDDSGTEGKRSQILIVDGEERFRETAAGMLRDHDLACTCAGNEAEARRLLSGKPYDLLIAEVKKSGNAEMPLVAAARQTAQDIPIILATNCPSVDTAVDAMRLKVEAYLIKPVDLGELLSLVRQCVARSQLLRSVAAGRKRAQAWTRELESLQRLFSHPFKTAMAEPLEGLLNGSFEMVVRSLDSLRTAVESLTRNSKSVPSVDFVVLSSRFSAARRVLGDAVQILEETKHAFKSKRLGELRQRLQALLARWDDA